MLEQKAFKPSKRKVENARREGHVIKSKYFSQVAVITVVSFAIGISIPRIWVAFKMLLEWGVTYGTADPLIAIRIAAGIVVQTAGIILGLGGLAALLSCAAQVGIRFETAVLSPRINRLNPVAGLKKILASAGKEVAQLLFRGLILLAIAWVGLAALTHCAALSLISSCGTGIAQFGAALVRLIAYLIVGSIALAIVDYALKRKNFYRELSMTHQEVKEERRNEEGDPFIAAARRSMHEALAMQDLVKRVRKSKVILVEKSIG